MINPTKEELELSFNLAKAVINGCDDEGVVKLSKKFNEASHGFTNGQVDLAIARFMGMKFSCYPDPTINLLVFMLLAQWMLEASIKTIQQESENATKN